MIVKRSPSEGFFFSNLHRKNTKKCYFISNIKKISFLYIFILKKTCSTKFSGVDKLKRIVKSLYYHIIVYAMLYMNFRLFVLACL